jgi:hypothetical protein
VTPSVPEPTFTLTPPTAIPTTPTPSPDPVPATEPPTSTPILEPTPTPVQRVHEWGDEFNGVEPDPTKWIPSTDKNRIYVRNGVLNLINELPTENLVGASMSATGAGRRIKEISFVITLKSFEGNVPGGAGLGVYLDGSRDLQVDVGPGPNGPGIEFSVCRNPRCSGDYNEYDHPNGGAFPVGIATPMQVLWTGQAIEFYVNNVLRVVQTQDPMPIANSRVSVYDVR